MTTYPWLQAIRVDVTGSETAEVVNSKYWDHDTAFEPIRRRAMTHEAVLRRDDISEFITKLYEGDLHAKRVLSLANATLGVLTSASLAVHAIGQGLAQAMGKLSKHGIKQVDRLLSNEAIDVETFFG